MLDCPVLMFFSIAACLLRDTRKEKVEFRNQSDENFLASPMSRTMLTKFAFKKIYVGPMNKTLSRAMKKIKL